MFRHLHLLEGGFIVHPLPVQLFLVSFVDGHSYLHVAESCSHFSQLAEIGAENGDIAWTAVRALAKEIEHEVTDHLHLGATFRIQHLVFCETTYFKHVVLRNRVF